MLKSACAALPTWLQNVRDLTHLMSFLSFWKFFLESLSCLLMCYAMEQEWGRWCSHSLALWARTRIAPVKTHPLAPCLPRGPARSQGRCGGPLLSLEVTMLSSACTLQGWWLPPPSSPLPRPSPLPTHSPLLLCPLHGEGKRRQTEMMKGFSVVHRKPRSRPVNARLSPNMWLWIWAEIQPTPHQLEYFWVCAAW